MVEQTLNAIERNRKFYLVVFLLIQATVLLAFGIIDQLVWENITVWLGIGYVLGNAGQKIGIKWAEKNDSE